MPLAAEKITKWLQFFVSSLCNLVNIYIQGSKPPGEYFNPGYDCLDILTQNRKAKDGFYWVDFHLSIPYKVSFQYILFTVFSFESNLLTK